MLFVKKKIRRALAFPNRRLTKSAACAKIKQKHFWHRYARAPFSRLWQTVFFTPEVPMKIPLHLLILAALCFGLCACGRTGIPAHTADSEDLTSASTVQTENPVSYTEEPSGSTPQTKDFNEPYADLSPTANLTPETILAKGEIIWSVVSSPDFYADGCDHATVKETVYSIRPELLTKISEGGDTISILYPVIDIPDAPEFAEALNQEIRDFMWLDASFSECELGYMHVTGTFAITWADKTHFSIACFQHYVYRRTEDFWYGVTVDVAAKKRMTLSDLSITSEKLEALLSSPNTRSNTILGGIELREWVWEEMEPEKINNFFIGAAPYTPTSNLSLGTPTSLNIILLWPCMGGYEDAVLKVPFEFEEQSKSDSAQAQ